MLSAQTESAGILVQNIQTEIAMKYLVNTLKDTGNKILTLLIRSVEISVIAYTLMFFVLCLMFKYIEL